MDSHDLNLNLPTSPCIPLIEASSQVRDEECFFWRHSSLSASFDFFPLHPQTRVNSCPVKSGNLFIWKKYGFFSIPPPPLSSLQQICTNKHVMLGEAAPPNQLQTPPSSLWLFVRSPWWGSLSLFEVKDISANDSLKAAAAALSAGGWGL